MRFGVVLVLALMFASGSAVGVAGTLILHEGPVIEGAITLTSQKGGVDLVPRSVSRDLVNLSWQSAVVTVHRTEWLVVLGQNASAPNRVATIERLDAGALDSIRCDVDCDALLYAANDGAVSVTASLAGPLGHSNGVLTYWAETKSGANHTFRHDFPPGTTWLGADTSSGPVVGNVTADGGLFLFASDALLGHIGANGTHGTIDLRDEEEAAVSPLGGAAMRVVSRFAVIELTGARFDSPLVATTVLLPDATGSSTGVLGASDASGIVHMDDRSVQFDHARIVFSGETDIALGVRAVASPPLGLTGQNSNRSLAFSGENIEVWLDGRLMVAPLGPNVVARSVVAIVVGAMLLALRFVIPLYSRISRERVLSNANRKALWIELEKSPGQSTTDLARELGLARVVVRHHLAMLSSHGLVAARAHGRSTRYYPLGSIPEKSELIRDDLEKSGTRYRIAQVVLRNVEGTTQTTIARATGVSSRLVSYHLGIMEALNLVEGAGSWRRTYRPTEKLVEAISLASENSRTEKV